jgi:hypothetical protein
MLWSIRFNIYQVVYLLPQKMYSSQSELNNNWTKLSHKRGTSTQEETEYPIISSQYTKFNVGIPQGHYYIWGCSVGIVRSRTQAMEFFYILQTCYPHQNLPHQPICNLV